MLALPSRHGSGAIIDNHIESKMPQIDASGMSMAVI